MTVLESIVEDLEAGEQPLEKSLEQFEKGIRISRECQTALRSAEQKVRMLVDKELKDVDPEKLRDSPDD